MKKLFLLLVAVLTISVCAIAQNRTVRGTVLDATTEEPLIGVSVTGGAGSGASTDIEGNFIITVPKDAKSLTVSYVGYETQVVAITSSNIVVKLQESTTTLNEVIAVAYGTAKRSEYTGSASVVKADQLEDALVSNVTNALTGKVSGVQTFSSNGQPGSSPSIRVRGTGSINADSSPLYVVDGVPFNGDIAAIPASDIEAMTVLKDAASTALYGARGANGVIMITTKKGNEGKAKVTLDARWGSNSRGIPSYEYVKDPRQYLEMVYQSMYNTYTGRTGQYNMTPEAANKYINQNIWSAIGYQTWTIPNGQNAFSSTGKFNPNATPGYSDGRYYYIADDWEKGQLSNGLRQEYNISINGGTNRLQYYLSGSYLGDEGIITNSHFKRLATRANVDYQAKDWLKIGTNTSYTYTNSGYPGDQTTSASSGNAFVFINELGPVYPMYIRNADGSIMYNSTYNRPIFDYGDGADYGNGILGSSRSPQGNPAGDLLYNKEDYLSDILDAKWYAVVTPIEGLSGTATASYLVDNTRYHYLANNLYGQSASYNGQGAQSQSRYRTFTFQGIINYNHTFNHVHTIDLMAGYESEAYNVENVQAIGSNLYQPGVFYVNNTIDNRRGYGYAVSTAHRGFIGRAKYNFNNKYYVVGSVRRDASSVFHPDHRWGTFWSLSAGWDIAKEEFMRNLEVVDLLKFKASFGQNGNDGVGSNGNAYSDQYTITGSDGVWSDGTLYYKGNKDITWETTNAFNVGFDFSLWKGILSGTLEYYNRQTSDMLFYIPVAPSLGYSSIPMNNGSMRNNGVELELNGQVFRTKDIEVELFANITFGWNKVLKLNQDLLDEDGYWKSSTYRWYKEGESMFQLALPAYAGVDPETGYALYLAKRTAKDENGVEYEEEYATPDWYEARQTNLKVTGNLKPLAYGGFGTNIKAYGFDLGLSFSYQFGGKVIDYGYQTAMQSGASIGSNFHVDALKAWTPTNTNTDVPLLFTSADKSYSNAMSDRWLISSNYVALNNITFGYTFPTKLARKLCFESIRVYGAAENVALWSKRKGLDPRQGSLSSNNETYSPIRSISGGIRVSF
jgi:TonB-linked SusC/RagA family outer membrane protein